MKNNNTIHYIEKCKIVYCKKANYSTFSGCYSYFIVFLYNGMVFKTNYKLDCFLANNLMYNNGEKVQELFIDWYFNKDTKKVNIIDIRKEV